MGLPRKRPLVTVVLGIDPGLDCGWAALDVGVGSPVYLDSGVLPRETRDAAFVELLVRFAPSLVAVEEVRGYGFDPARVAALIEAAKIGATLSALASGRGIHVEQATAIQWRKALCRNGSATDALIKRVILFRVPTWPKRSANHERDAAGCAIYGAERVRLKAAGLGVMLTDRVRSKRAAKRRAKATAPAAKWYSKTRPSASGKQ